MQCPEIVITDIQRPSQLYYSSSLNLIRDRQVVRIGERAITKIFYTLTPTRDNINV